MNLGALDRLTEILRREKPDILHSFRDKANFWARWAGARAGVPITITSCRNRMMELRYLATEWFMSRKSRLILANSIGVKHELTRWARVPPDKIRVIYNLLDVADFRPPTRGRAGAARAAWELPAGAARPLLPGRIGLQKHQLGVLWAMRALARRGRWPADAVVLLAGRERDRADSALVRRLARDPPPRRLGALPGRGQGRSFALLGVRPPAHAVALRGAGQRGARRVRGRAARDPVARRQRRRDRPPRRDRLGGSHRPPRRRSVRALEEALATPDERLAAMGRAARSHVVARFAPPEHHVLDQMVAVYDELLAAGAPA